MSQFGCLSKVFCLTSEIPLVALPEFLDNVHLDSVEPIVDFAEELVTIRGEARVYCSQASTESWRANNRTPQFEMKKIPQIGWLESWSRQVEWASWRRPGSWKRPMWIGTAGVSKDIRRRSIQHSGNECRS